MRSARSAVLISLGVVILVAVEAWIGRGWQADRERAGAATVAASVQRRVDTLVATALDGVRGGAGEPVADGGPEKFEEAARQLGADPSASVELAASAARARDSGRPVLSSPLSAVDRPGVATVIAIDPEYANGTTPRTTAERRRAVTGYVLAVVPVPEALAGATSGVRVSEGGAVLAANGPIGTDPDLSVRFAIEDREWLVAVDHASGFPGAVTAGIVAIVVVGAGIVAASLLLQRRRSVAAEAARTAERENQLLRQLVVVSQGSLDLGDALPTLATMLLTGLPVDGVAIELTSGSGPPTTAFTAGSSVDPTVAAVVEPPTHLAAGSTVALSLANEQRPLGVLRLRVTRPTDDNDQRLLAVAADQTRAVVTNGLVHGRQEEALRRLQEIDELKTVFLGTASHELRTPVTAIRGFTRVLNERAATLSDDERRLVVERLAANASGLELLVEQLLDFSRLEQGRIGTVRERLALDEIVTATIAKLGPLLSDHVIEPVVTEPVVVVGDRGALDRIVSNLVSNAAKFSPAGSRIELSVTTDRRGDEPRGLIVVDDEGAGVPLAERDKIFLRFYRGKGEAVVRSRGSGIGLSVVKELVTMLGGQITVDDSPSGGARFEVSLPLAEATTIVDPVKERHAETS